MELNKIIEDFKNKTGYQLEEKDGNLYYGGYLDLSGTGITSLPEGLTVGGSLDLRGTGITSLPEGLTVGGSLDLEGCTGITSLPEGLTVGGYLDLSDTGITSLPEGLTVGGSLDLRGTGITSLPEGLTVGGYLDLSGTGITSLPEGLTVGDYLDLEGCTGITSLPEGLTVGNYLDLRGTGITSLPEGLTVGDYLDLSGTGITSLPEGLTVGGYLYLSGTGITNTGGVNHTLSHDAKARINAVNRTSKQTKFWEWHGRKYIKVDGMFAELLHHRGNVYHVRNIGATEKMYIVTDGDNHYAHGNTLTEARADLLYKIADRDTSAYECMKLDDVLTFEDAIAAYRTITGSCAAGTRDYVENRLPKPHKKSYTIREIIELTKGEYQSEVFKNFFTNAKRK